MFVWHLNLSYVAFSEKLSIRHVISALTFSALRKVCTKFVLADYALVVSRVSLMRGPISVSLKKRNCHCKSRTFFLKWKKRRLKRSHDCFENVIEQIADFLRKDSRIWTKLPFTLHMACCTPFSKPYYIQTSIATSKCLPGKLNGRMLSTNDNMVQQRCKGRFKSHEESSTRVTNSLAIVNNILSVTKKFKKR